MKMSIIQVPGIFTSNDNDIDVEQISLSGRKGDRRTRTPCLDTGSVSGDSESQGHTSIAPSLASCSLSDLRGNVRTPPDQLLEKAEGHVVHLINEGKTEEALKELIKCTALVLLVYGPNHWKYAEAYANLGQAYLDLKGSAFAAQAEGHSETAKKFLQNGQHNPTSEAEKLALLKAVIVTYHTLARAQALLKKNADAETSILKATSVLGDINRLSAVTEDYSVKTGIKLHICASKISSRLNKQAVAVSHYEAALELATLFYGEDQPELIPIYQGLGQMEQSKGKQANHDKAIENYLRAHAIATKCHNEGSSEVADTARSLAIAYSKTGNLHAETSSESYLNECLSIYLSIHGPNHASVCQVQMDLARLLIRTNRQDEGIKLLRKCLPSIIDVYGEFSDETLAAHKLIGSTLLSQCEMESALKAFNKCLQIEELKFGMNSKQTKPTRNIIDTIIAHPTLAAKQVDYGLKTRPRFNTIAKK